MGGRERGTSTQPGTKKIITEGTISAEDRAAHHNHEARLGSRPFNEPLQDTRSGGPEASSNEVTSPMLTLAPVQTQDRLSPHPLRESAQMLLRAGRAGWADPQALRQPRQRVGEPGGEDVEGVRSTRDDH
jgi:hypothetical protein